MNELEELNAVQMEEVAGGALQIPNTVKVITSGGYTALHSTPENVLPAWGALLLMIAIFTVVALIALKSIDKDKR